jgi:hypothetical protein
LLAAQQDSRQHLASLAGSADHRPVPLRLFVLAMLLAALGALGGCLDTVAEALLAPESLAVQGVSGGVQSVTATSASDVQAAFSSTAQQLDDIIAANPNAANRPELAALKDKLGSSTPASTHAEPQDGSWATEPEQLAPFDRRVLLGPENTRQRSDTLLLAQAGHPRRPQQRPPAAPEPTLLDRWEIQPYIISPFSVRVQ